MSTTTDSQILYDKNLLIIGGTGRNVGKTTLATEIIRKVSPLHRVTGLKVSTHKKGEEEYHGDHHESEIQTFRINIEKGLQPQKDTAVMLKAGASDAYFIETADEYVKAAWTEFISSYNQNHNAVVCESRSLRKHVKPGVFILLINPDNAKDSSLQYKEMADLVHYYNNDIEAIIRLAQSIEFTSEGWVINNKQPQHPDAIL